MLSARRLSRGAGTGAGTTVFATLALVALLTTSCSQIDSRSEATESSISLDDIVTTTSPENSSPENSAAPESVEPETTSPSTTVLSVPETSQSTTTAIEAPAGIASLVPEIVATHPHDPLAFTQGLEFHNGALIESLGEYGRSSRRIVDPSTGAVSSEVALPLEQFGQGLTVVDDRLIQLTWRSGRAIVSDPSTLEATDQYNFEGEGWGLCAQPTRLVMSNGSSTLTFRDPVSFEPTGSVEVTINGEPISNLNELECVDGQVWANVWLTNQILQIDPSTGVVTATVDASSLVPTDQTLGREDVLNGIAFNPDSSTFWVTGKRWATVYEVRFVPAG